MTKAELIEKVSKDCRCSKAMAESAINSMTGNITRALKRGQKLTLTGFGTFNVTRRKARKGRNPQTGAVIQIKAQRVPKFRPGKELREAVS
jgi:DNA-binding protein HU-beta